MADSDSVVVLADSDSDAAEEDDANLPSREECEERCQMFAEVTGTDSALAMFYLQDREWNVERAISDYFAEQDSAGTNNTQGPRRVSPVGKSRSNKTAGTGSRAGAASGRGVTSGSSADDQSLTLGPSVLQPEQEGVVRVLSWNIDGLDPDNLQSRTEGACAVLLQEHPEVIFLQEVVHRNLDIIRARLEPQYTVITGDLDPANTPGAYFTAMLLRKTSVALEKARVLDFPGTLMSRDLMEVQCRVRGVPVVLLTSHLESTKDYGDERKRQLKTAFDQMVASPPDRTVIFGGDLNLRDKEVSGASAKPANVHDIWECTGKRQEAKFTWDLMVNDNKQLGSKFQPRCRFDRLYVRPGHGLDINSGGGGEATSRSSAEPKAGAKPISSFFTNSGKKRTSSGSVKDNSSSNSGDTAQAKSCARSSSSSSGSKDLGTSKGSGSILKDAGRETSGKAGERAGAAAGKVLGLKPVYFELVGIQRLASCRRFPSDHWGILAHFEIV